MNLNEVGNRPYKFKKTASTKRKWNAVFTTDEGANYIFDAELHGLANWRVTFLLMKAHPRGGTLADFGVTGTEGTNAVRVLGTVKEIFEKFVKEINPDTVIFVADKSDGSGRGSRTKLYNRFAKTFARDHGYELDKDESASETEFAFYKINEVKSRRRNQMHTFKNFRNFMIEAKSKSQFAKDVRDASFASDDPAADDYKGPSPDQLFKAAEKEHGSQFAKQLRAIPDSEVYGDRTHGKGRTKPGQFGKDYGAGITRDSLADPDRKGKITKSGKLDKTQARTKKKSFNRARFSKKNLP